MGNKKGVLVLFSGPSGVGKDTVLDIVLNKDKNLQKSISLTTRGIRENEVDGKDYYFISTEKFEDMISHGQVLEYAKYGSNFYGTPKAPIDEWLGEGKTVILKIEVQGASKIKELYPDSVSIFVLPPSMEELESRLRSRGTESEDDIKKRLDIARGEVERSNDYDFIVINDDLEIASDKVIAIVNNL
jgi:guanylate kinase